MCALPAPSHARYRTPDPPPTGVGGWLAFFIFATVVFSAFYLLADGGYLVRDFAALHREFPSIHGRTLFYLMDHVAWIAVRCYAIYAGVRLWRISPGAVETAKRFLVLFALVSFAQFAGLLMLWGVHVAEVSELTRESSPENFKLLTSFAQSIVYSLLWYSYFSRSVRVRNTYGLPPAIIGEGVSA
jgi:hypothetical protein